MPTPMSKKDTATMLRTRDLAKLLWSDLAALCQRFGQSGRGSRDELIERLRKQIWRAEYD